MKEYQILTSLSCNLRCTYCYEEFNDRVNELEDCKLYIKGLFERDKNYHKFAEDKRVTLDFIGGEPFLHPDLLRGIFEYSTEIKDEYNISEVLFSISTNGTLLSTPKAKKLLEDWGKHMNLGISLDGTKEKHDLHRLTINGMGSYDSALKGYLTAREVGVRWINFKSTFTKETIGQYFESFKSLIALKPNSLYLNFAFEEVLDEYDAIHISLELLNCFEYYFSLPKEGRPFIDTIFEHEGFTSGYNPMKPEVNTLLTENRCGTVTSMSCLGFDRKVYGCNRFVSMAAPGMEVGILKDDATFEKVNHSLIEKVSNSYKTLPEYCKTCRHNFICSDCIALPFDEGITQEELYGQRRQCGFTKAKELAKMWGKRLEIRLAEESNRE